MAKLICSRHVPRRFHSFPWIRQRLCSFRSQVFDPWFLVLACSQTTHPTDTKSCYAQTNLPLGQNRQIRGEKKTPFFAVSISRPGKASTMEPGPVHTYTWTASHAPAKCTLAPYPEMPSSVACGMFVIVCVVFMEVLKWNLICIKIRSDSDWCGMIVFSREIWL